MIIYRTTAGILGWKADTHRRLLPGVTIEAILQHEEPLAWLSQQFDAARDVEEMAPLLPPIDTQEV